MPFLNVESGSITLEKQLELLTMEASVLSNVISTFRSILPNLSSKLETVCLNLQTSDDHTKTVEELNKFTEIKKDHIRNVGIVKHTDTLIPVPEGFDRKANMCQYLDSLIQACPLVINGIQEILSEYHIVISTFISNKDAKKTLQDHSTFYKRIKKQRHDVTEPLSSYFDSGVDRSRLPFGEVYNQSAELITAVEKINKLNKFRSMHDLKSVKNQVQDCSSLLKMIIDNSEKQDFTEVSGAVAMDLAEGAIEVGNWVELVSIFHFRVEQAIQNVKLQIEFVSKLN